MIPANSNPSAVTLLTPTHNRPQFLRRMLCFFEQIELKHPILIVDSSEAEKAAENRSACDLHSAKLQIRYTHVSMSFGPKCLHGVEEVETPYVSFCADDDFQFPVVVQQCIEFLQHHPEYNIAQGRVIHASNARTGDDSIFHCHLLDGYDLEQTDAADRFRQIATRTFSTFYGVYRREQLAEAFQRTLAHTDYEQGRVFVEALLLALSVIAGKVKVFSDVQYIQETHGENESRVVPRVVDKSQTTALYERYATGLRESLAATSKWPNERIDELVTQHGSFISGMGRGKRQRLSVSQKLAREWSRAHQSVIQWMQHAIRFGSRSGASAVMQNEDVFPAGEQYVAAKRLLTTYPTGMPPL